MQNQLKQLVQLDWLTASELHNITLLLNTAKKASIDQKVKVILIFLNHIIINQLGVKTYIVNQFGFDGSNEYSRIENVLQNTEATEFLVFPDPATTERKVD